MTSFTTYLAAAAAIGFAAPAAAQYQQYPQPYPQQYPQTYPQQGTGYGYPGQAYSQNPVQQVIDSLLGNRYNVTDRTAVSQCANAAMIQAQSQYRGYGPSYGNNPYGNYPQGYGGGYGQGIAAPSMRVTAITDVQRRSGGLRVKGLISSGYGGRGGYGQNGYQNGGYATGDLTFRCNVDYRGAVTNVRLSRNSNYGYRRY
jgi:hypothetical protein